MACSFPTRVAVTHVDHSDAGRGSVRSGRRLAAQHDLRGVYGWLTTSAVAATSPSPVDFVFPPRFKGSSRGCCCCYVLVCVAVVVGRLNGGGGGGEGQGNGGDCGW